MTSSGARGAQQWLAGVRGEARGLVSVTRARGAGGGGGGGELIYSRDHGQTGADGRRASYLGARGAHVCSVTGKERA